jgi:hypothetical protein
MEKHPREKPQQMNSNKIDEPVDTGSVNVLMNRASTVLMSAVTETPPATNPP